MVHQALIVEVHEVLSASFCINGSEYGVTGQCCFDSTMHIHPVHRTEFALLKKLNLSSTCLQGRRFAILQ